MNGPGDMQPARAEQVHRLSYEDYLRLPDDGLRHELIDGEHFVTPAPVLRHQRISMRLSMALGAYLGEHPLGEICYAPMDVILSDHDVVQPDILYVSKARSEILRDWVHGAPDLAIEILSPSTRRTDELIKRRLYERFDVREYWVVDPEIDAVKVYRLESPGHFSRAVEVTAERDEVLATPLLPGFGLPLRTLFAD